MDLNEDLLTRADFFDFVKLNSNELTPVAFIDSVDYGIQNSPDGNNNILGTSGHIKSFLDEILSDPLSNSNSESMQINQSHANTFELLGTFQWAGGGEGDSERTSSSSWLPAQRDEGEVTTLTNLLDPLFVPYGDAKVKLDHDYMEDQPAVSSNLITTTFLSSPNDPNGEGDVPTTIEWKQDVGSPNSGESSLLFCDDSLLRSALQAGNLILKPANLKGVGEMSELRKVLSFPPLVSSPNNNSLSSDVQTDSSSNSPPFPSYELKVFNCDPLFNSNGTIDESNIPNVEELIMTRIDPPFSSKAVSEKKINSTSLSSKFSYNMGPAKIRKRSGKKKDFNPDNNNNNNSVESQNNSGNSSTSSSTSNGSGPTRKERSLHYCNICCKGFKDKYSVNVHVRTHTGEKPFSCSLCGKSFRQKAHLAKHYQTHAAKGNASNGKQTNNNNNNNKR